MRYSDNQNFRAPPKPKQATEIKEVEPGRTLRASKSVNYREISSQDSINTQETPK